MCGLSTRTLLIHPFTCNYAILKFGERAFSVATPNIEPAANRTHVDAFHASFQAFFENVCPRWSTVVLRDRTIKLDSVMRDSSRCRRRTISTVDYDYDCDYRATGLQQGMAVQGK